MVALARTRGDQHILNYRAAVYKLLRKHFHLTILQEQQESGLFAQYIDQVDHGLAHLLENKKIRPSFKARGLAQILAPAYTYRPFVTNKDMNIGNMPVLHCARMLSSPSVEEKECLATLLTPKLRSFLVDVLELDVRTVTEAKQPNMENWMKSVRFGQYNIWVISLLEILDETDPLAERLFSNCLRLEAIDADNGNHGYNSFYKLMTSTVPAKWKERGDEYMRAEVLSCIDSRRPFEPYYKYFEHVRKCVELQEFPYTVELLATQIQFVIGCGSDLDTMNWIWNRGDQHDRWRVAHRLFDRLLVGQQWKDLRLAVIRHALDGRHSPIVDSWQPYDFVRYLLKKVGRADEELSRRLQALLDAHNEKRQKEIEQDAQARETAQAVKADLLARMS